MSNVLRLKVILDTLDKACATLKKISAGSDNTAKTLKAAKGNGILKDKTVLKPSQQHVIDQNDQRAGRRNDEAPLNYASRNRTDGLNQG